VQTALNVYYPAEDLFLAEVTRVGKVAITADTSEDFYSFSMHDSWLSGCWLWMPGWSSPVFE